MICGFVMGCERRVVDGHRFCGKCWGIVIVMSGVVSVVVDVYEVGECWVADCVR